MPASLPWTCLPHAAPQTLMDVIAGRKTAGRMTGSITVNGHPKEQRTFARITGYVEQTGAGG